MRDDGRVTRFARHFDGFDGFGDGADLIELDQDRIADFFRNATSKNLRIGYKNIIADQLNFAAEFGSEMFPSRPIVFGEAVFERDDGELPHPIGPKCGHLFRRARGLVGFLEYVFIAGFVEELACRGIERDGDVLARLVAGCRYGFEDNFDRFVVRFQVGCEAAFVADRG